MCSIGSMKLALMLGLCVVVTGCATSRSEIKISSPAAGATALVNANGPVAVIRSVSDERVFEQAPQDPSTPSLGFEGAAQASAEVKARAIGRKRNTYGKALGDVLLQPGQTVDGIVRENLATALQQAGYQVKSEKDAPDAPLRIEVGIKKFWAWLQPGFWAIKLHTQIATDLRVNGSNTPVPVAVKTEEGMQIVTDSSWMETIGKALDSYRNEATKALANLPKPR